MNAIYGGGNRILKKNVICLVGFLNDNILDNVKILLFLLFLISSINLIFF